MTDQNEPPRIIPPHGGYRELQSYQMAEIVFDGTAAFCDRFIDRRSRTHDQMVQAARSGKQNIAEGSMASGTSKKTELKLIGVARASLEELLIDFQDYLRQKGRDINLMDDEYFDSITPPEPFILPLKSILFILFFLVLSFSIFIIGYNNSGRLSSYLQNLKKINENKELSKIKLPDFNPNLIVSPKENDIKFSYDEKEIKRKFENIKQNILNDKAVAAVLEINEIKLSNASESVKLKTDILKTFIREPDYAFFKNQITYSDILNEKKSLNGNIRLYDDVFVLWEGRIVNLKIGKEEIIFDYILGDEEKGIVLGIEKVVFKKAVIIKNNDKIKVFGKIKVNDKSFYIDGKFVIKN